MCKINNELKNLSFTIQNNLRDIVENPKCKREGNKKKLMLASWHQSFQNSMNKETDPYKKLILYSFDNMVTYKHSEALTSDELLVFMLGVMNIMIKVKEGDFNEQP